MLKYIKQLFVAFCCFAAVSCNSENELVEVIEPPFLIGDSDSPPVDPPEIDILLVLDNSCSMMEDWDYITYGLTQIPIELNNNGFDWKMGIISMDPTDAIFVEVDSAIDPNDVGWEMISIIDGFRLIAGGGEQAFLSAINARSRFSPWFRPGVKTLIVFISDEKEQSNISPQDFNHLWGYPHVVASIVGPEYADPYYPSCAEEAKPFHDVSLIVIDICVTERWSVIEPLLE
jgi:hypothetical protein